MKFCKTALVVSVAGFVQISATAQTAPGTSPVFSAERGRHHQLVQTVRQVTNERGQVSDVVGRYAVLGNGLNFTNAAGQWQPAVPLVQDFGNFIVCTGATYRVVLNANLNTYGAVDLETSDQQRMVSHPLGIAFYDPESGRREVLAQVKDSRAELVSSNLIVFRDAFEGSGIEASVTYGYKRGRFHQDVTFVRGPSGSPTDYGMGSQTRLEVLTEFVESPQPVKTLRVLKRELDELKRQRMVEPDLVDEKLDYGEMTMLLGRGFSSDSTKRNGIPVAKRLVNIEGRTILVEAVEWRDAQAELEKLPRQASTGPRSNYQATSKRELPQRSGKGELSPSFPSRLAEVIHSRAKKSGLASLRPPSATSIPLGFVMDYEQVETADDVTFESGQTYLVPEEVILGGVTTFESGAVIKYAYETDACIVLGDIVCSQSGAKTVFTASEDSTVGEQIGSYTGEIIDWFALEALRFEFPENDFLLENVDIRHAWTGVSVVADNNAPTIYNSRFGHCSVAISQENAWVWVDTVEMCDVSTWYENVGENGSIDGGDVIEFCADSDWDNLLDAWEVAHFGNLNQTGSGDYDGDGLKNWQEYQLGTNPYQTDSDGDGLNDGYEATTLQTNPALADTGSTGTSDGYKDADGDGLTNLEEFKLGKNPLVPNVASLTFSPKGGSYDSAQEVTITSPTVGAIIRHTTDGSEPIEGLTQDSTATVDASLTVKAKAWKAGWTTSDTENQSYVMEAQPPSNEAPTVTISPSGSVSLLASDSIEILVEAEDAYGTITKVQLYRGDYKVAESTTSPLRYTLANVPENIYIFKAKVMDNDGAVTESDSVTITITDSGPVVSLVGVQPFFTSSPGMLIARVTGVNPHALSTLTLNGNAIPKRTGEFTINVALTEGENMFTLSANGTASASTTVYLDSTAPVIAITAPANNANLSTTRVNVSGTFTETSLKRITVNGVLAFTGSGTFTALNVPLATGANAIVATAEDIAGNTRSVTNNITGGSTLVDPVQLGVSTVGGFVSLPVTFTPTTSVPGTLQQVKYDFTGDNASFQTATDLNPVGHTYNVAGEYFPVVTIVTTVGSFSSLGGWNSTTADRLRINVQVAPQQVGSAISITDPVDLKTTANGHLFVLSSSTRTIKEYDATPSEIRSLTSIGTVNSSPTGLDVEADGNIYVALSGDHRVAKYKLVSGSYVLDTDFGNAGLIGSSGTGNGQFNTPYDVAVSPDGTEIAVSDSGNHRIQRFNIADNSGSFLGTFGSSGSGAGQFNTPKGLTYDGSGYLYIVDSGNSRIGLALSSAVIGTSGSSGTALGQFQGAVNLCVGTRGIYVAETYVGGTGNNWVQVFDLIASGHGKSPTPFTGRLSLSSQLGLSQPHAVAPIADFLAEKIYIADTGNNRVLLTTLPADDPEIVWSTMKQSLVAGNIEAAMAFFSASSLDNYRHQFFSVGAPTLAPIISQIPSIAPVFIERDTAQYHFEKEIQGVLLTFPIEFVKENGLWKIVEF